ncbi:unnamed protein product [Rhizophagus irregularis]|nr:unnamed protein product [Rhizophagus irregularis]
MMKASGQQESTIIQEKSNKFNVLSDKWSFASYRDYNMAIRKELQKLVPELIKKYRHIDAIDEKKSFIDRPENASIFTDFIQSAFKLFIQENLLNKDVINAVKDLNYITVDMEIFAMDGRDILRKLDIRSILKLDM